MMIADAQIHLWAKGRPSAHHRQTPYLKEEALADPSRFQAAAPYMRPIYRDDNWWLYEIVAWPSEAAK